MNPSLFKLRLSVFLLLWSASAASLAQTYYYYVGYMAQTAPYEYKHVFEKKIVSIPNASNANAANQLRDDYVAYVKEKHPDYFKGYVNKLTDQKQIDFSIRAQAKIQGHFLKEADARNAMEAEMRDRRASFAANPANGPVVVTEDYAYKKW